MSERTVARLSRRRRCHDTSHARAQDSCSERQQLDLSDDFSCVQPPKRVRRGVSASSNNVSHCGGGGRDDISESQPDVVDAVTVKHSASHHNNSNLAANTTCDASQNVNTHESLPLTNSSPARRSGISGGRGGVSDTTLLSCPVCLRRFSSSAARLSHLKPCARRHNLSVDQLIEAISLQRRQVDERAARGLPAAPPPLLRPSRRVGTADSDTDMQMALALSASLCEPGSHDVHDEGSLSTQTASVAVSVSDTRNSQNTGRTMTQMSLVPNGGECMLSSTGGTKSRECTVAALSAAARARIVADNIASLLSWEHCVLAEHGHVSGSQGSASPRLWHISQLHDHTDSESFYVRQLDSWVDGSCVSRVGSLLKDVSSVPCRVSLTQNTSEAAVSVDCVSGTQCALLSLAQSAAPHSEHGPQEVTPHSDCSSEPDHGVNDDGKSSRDSPHAGHCNNSGDLFSDIQTHSAVNDKTTSVGEIDAVIEDRVEILPNAADTQDSCCSAAVATNTEISLGECESSRKSLCSVAGAPSLGLVLWRDLELGHGDCWLHCCGGSVSYHRAVVSARCCGLVEADLSQFSARCVRLFLYYLYTGELEACDEADNVQLARLADVMRDQALSRHVRHQLGHCSNEAAPSITSSSPDLMPAANTRGDFQDDDVEEDIALTERPASVLRSPTVIESSDSDGQSQNSLTQLSQRVSSDASQVLNDPTSCKLHVSEGSASARDERGAVISASTSASSYDRTGILHQSQCDHAPITATVDVSASDFVSPLRASQARSRQCSSSSDLFMIDEEEPQSTSAKCHLISGPPSEQRPVTDRSLTNSWDEIGEGCFIETFQLPASSLLSSTASCDGEIQRCAAVTRSSDTTSSFNTSPVASQLPASPHEMPSSRVVAVNEPAVVMPTTSSTVWSDASFLEQLDSPCTSVATTSTPARASCCVARVSSSPAPSCSLHSSNTPVNPYRVTLAASHTPVPDYVLMLTPQLKAELARIGVKPIARRKAVALLSHVYSETHPVINKAPVSVTSHTGSTLSCPSPVSTCSHATTAPSTRQHDTDDVSDDDEEDRDVSHAIPPDVSQDSEDMTSSQQAVPEHRVNALISEFIRSQSALYEKILLYEPVWLQSLHSQLKNAGHKISLARLMDFLDEQCITFRSENSANRRRSPAKKRARNKRGGKTSRHAGST